MTDNVAVVSEREVVSTEQVDAAVVVVPAEERVLVIEQNAVVAAVEDTQVAAVETQEVVVVAAGCVGPPGAKGDTGDTGPQGTQGEVGPAGPGGAGAAIPVRAFVPAAISAEIERIDATVYRSVKWVITVTDPFGGRYRMGEILAFHDGAEARFVHYAIFGDSLQYAVDVILIGGDMVLRVTNAEAVQLTVDAVRVGNLLI
jgi:hypothetical protein